MSDSHLRSDRSTCVSCLRSITIPKRERKGKPVARRGRKAYGPPKEVAGLPKRREGPDQGWDRQEEWEPSGALRSALEGMSLELGTEKERNLARLEPHV